MVKDVKQSKRLLVFGIALGVMVLGLLGYFGYKKFIQGGPKDGDGYFFEYYYGPGFEYQYAKITKGKYTAPYFTLTDHPELEEYEVDLTNEQTDEIFKLIQEFVEQPHEKIAYDDLPECVRNDNCMDYPYDQHVQATIAGEKYEIDLIRQEYDEDKLQEILETLKGFAKKGGENCDGDWECLSFVCGEGVCSDANCDDDTEKVLTGSTGIEYKCIQLNGRDMWLPKDFAESY